MNNVLRKFMEARTPFTVYAIDKRHTFTVSFHSTSSDIWDRAVLAQLVEHITRNDEVVGSIPTNGSKKTSTYNLGCRCFFIHAVVNAV